MEPRSVVIVGVHLVGALLFAAMAIWAVLTGDPVFAVVQGVLAALVVTLGVGLARAA